MNTGTKIGIAAVFLGGLYYLFGRSKTVTVPPGGTLNGFKNTTGAAAIVTDAGAVITAGGKILGQITGASGKATTAVPGSSYVPVGAANYPQTAQQAAAASAASGDQSYPPPFTSYAAWQASLNETIQQNTSVAPNPAWIEPIAGCMDPAAENFNPSATSNDGSCTYSTAFPQSQDTSIPGCTDPDAVNFNYNATTDDGSCVYDSVSGMGRKSRNIGGF